MLPPCISQITKLSAVLRAGDNKGNSPGKVLYHFIKNILAHLVFVVGEIAYAAHHARKHLWADMAVNAVGLKPALDKGNEPGLCMVGKGLKAVFGGLVTDKGQGVALIGVGYDGVAEKLAAVFIDGSS